MVAEVLVLETKHVQQVLRKDADNTDARQLFKHLKAMDKAKLAGNAAFKSGELDEANLKFCCVLYANRAAVWLKQKEFANHENASQAIALDAGYVKATEKEIKKAFRKMAMQWLPDKFASKSNEEKAAAEEMFKEISEAYKMLKDTKLEQRYDSGVDID